jgi:hypothetical protein
MRYLIKSRGGSQPVLAAPICSAAARAGAAGTSAARNCWLWTQLAVAYAVLEVALWSTGEAQRIASLAFIFWIAVTTLWQRRSARELGLGAAGLRGALVALPIAAVASALILLVGWTVGTLRPLYGTRPPLTHSLGYVLWAMVQEFILNSYFFGNLERLLRSTRAAMWAAVLLFTLAHIPNPVLLPATFVGALFFVSVFRRYRNIYPLGVAHALLGLALAATVPDALLRHMRVGIAYFHFVAR